MSLALIQFLEPHIIYYYQLLFLTTELGIALKPLSTKYDPIHSQ